MLFDMFQQGLITLDEYKKRAPFAFIRDVHSGEQTQWGRAQQINEVLSSNWEELNALAETDPLLPFDPQQGIPVLWADDPAVHMRALEELILDDRRHWGIRRLAMDRYSVYEELASSKAAMSMGQQIDPNTGQPLPPPPVPPEVIGAPLGLPVGQPQPLQIPPPASVPGQGGPQSLVAPESGAVPSAASSLSPQPLGSFGAIEEQAAAQGQIMPV